MISLAVYLAFELCIFSRMVRKHTARILGYAEERQFFLKFFDVKAFCIMGFMIAMGVGLRVSGLCPDVFIAVFYTGLGASCDCRDPVFEELYPSWGGRHRGRRPG